MPVLRTTRTYRCRSGKRFVRLYQTWRNMRSRVKGNIRSGNGEAIWVGVGIAPEWQDFDNFRAWALANGYSRKYCSLDRKRTAEGYGPDNCRWLTVAQNSLLALYPDYFEMGGVTVFSRGAEAPF